MILADSGGRVAGVGTVSVVIMAAGMSGLGGRGRVIVLLSGVSVVVTTGWVLSVHALTVYPQGVSVEGEFRL